MPASGSSDRRSSISRCSATRAARCNWRPSATCRSCPPRMVARPWRRSNASSMPRVTPASSSRRLAVAAGAVCAWCAGARIWRRPMRAAGPRPVPRLAWMRCTPSGWSAGHAISKCRSLAMVSTLSRWASGTARCSAVSRSWWRSPRARCSSRSCARRLSRPRCGWRVASTTRAWARSSFWSRKASRASRSASSLSKPIPGCRWSTPSPSR